MQWWRTQQDGWRACRTNPVPPAEAMKDYVAWLKDLGGQPIFVAHPVAFDYPFIAWYLWEFTGEDPYDAAPSTFPPTQARSSTARVTEAKTSDMPEHWFDQDYNHNHQPSTDALSYAKLTCNIWADAARR